MSPLRTLGPYSEGILVRKMNPHIVKEGKILVDTAIALDIDTDEVLGMYFDYLRLLNLQKLMTLYWELGDEDFSLLEYLYSQLKWEGLATKKDIHRIVGAAGELRNLDQALIEAAADFGRLNSIKFQAGKGCGRSDKNDRRL